MYIYILDLNTICNTYKRHSISTWSPNKGRSHLDFPHGMLSICHRRLWWAQSSAPSVSSSLICRPGKCVAALIKFRPQTREQTIPNHPSPSTTLQRKCPEAQFFVLFFVFFVCVCVIFLQICRNILCLQFKIYCCILWVLCDLCGHILQRQAATTTTATTTTSITRNQLSCCSRYSCCQLNGS